jgi:hypothetical protein
MISLLQDKKTARSIEIAEMSLHDTGRKEEAVSMVEKHIDYFTESLAR